MSNEDDIAGQVQRAFNKATHEALHDVQLAVTGSSVTDTTEFRANKIYQGQQLVVFGRYTQPGNALIDVEAKLKGTPHSFAQQFGLPDVNTDNAELEQLWALDMVHALEKKNMLGLLSDANAKAQITELGVNHQLVTDYTAMIVVDEATLEKYGVEQSGESPGGGLGNSPSGGSSGGSGYSGSGDSDYAGAIDSGQLALWALLLLSLGLIGSLATAEGGGRVSAFRSGWPATLLRRGPLLTLTLAAVAIAAGASTDLQLSRGAVLDGEAWRLVTGHFVHFGRAHAVGDILGFIGWAAIIEAISRRLLVAAVSLAALGVSVGVLALCPEVQVYGGLSAIDVALATTLLCVLATSRWIRGLPGGRVLIGVIAAAHVFKAGYEVLLGNAILAPDLGPGVKLLPTAHLVGAACGVAAWWIVQRGGGVRRMTLPPLGGGSTGGKPNTNRSMTGERVHHGAFGMELRIRALEYEHQPIDIGESAGQVAELSLLNHLSRRTFVVLAHRRDGASREQVVTPGRAAAPALLSDPLGLTREEGRHRRLDPARFEQALGLVRLLLQDLGQIRRRRARRPPPPRPL